MSHAILPVGTLDTRGAEYAYARDLIERRGHKVILMDAGVFGEQECAFAPDIDALRIAAAAGGDLQALRGGRDSNRNHVWQVAAP